MRFFYIFLILLLPFCAIAQSTDTPSDTIQGVETDTSITYIIKKPALTVKQRIEIEREKEKKFYYFSLGVLGYLYHQEMKGNTATPEFINSLSRATKNTGAYGFEFTLLREHKKYSYEFIADVIKISEQFTYTDTSRQTLQAKNSYTYFNFSLLIGKWYKRTRNLSYHLAIGPTIAYYYGSNGYTYTVNDTTAAGELDKVINFKPIVPGITIRGGFRLRVAGYNSICLSPTVWIPLLSYNKTTSSFSTHRVFAGLHLTFTGKLF